MSELQWLDTRSFWKNLIFHIHTLSFVFALSVILFLILQRNGVYIVPCATKSGFEVAYKMNVMGFPLLWKSANDVAQPKQMRRAISNIVNSMEENAEYFPKELLILKHWRNEIY